MAGSPQQILIVCTGNVCRSPMAEKLLAHALQAEPEPLRSIRVVSAGIATDNGLAASNNARTALERVNINLTAHRSQLLSEKLLKESDLILAMTESHRYAIRNHFAHIKQPVFLFREFMDSADQQVPDPYGGALSVYLETRDSLAEAVPSIISYLKKAYNLQ